MNPRPRSRHPWLPTAFAIVVAAGGAPSAGASADPITRDGAAPLLAAAIPPSLPPEERQVEERLAEPAGDPMPATPAMAPAATPTVAAAPAPELAPVLESPATSPDVIEVASELLRRRPALAACYERELRHHPTLAGSAELRFTVDRRGRVTRARVGRDQLHNPRLGRCLVERVGGVRFAPPSGGPLAVAYPVRFQPRL